MSDCADCHRRPVRVRALVSTTSRGHRRTTVIAAGAIGNDLPITIVSEEWTSPELQVLVMTELGR